MRLLILITFLLTSCAQAEIKQAHEFGGHLKTIVIKNDHEAFSSLTCFPANCIDSHDIDYVFGADGVASFIKSFLENPSI